jgi:hypothetical protein
MTRPERREGLNENEFESHHFSRSIGLPALTICKEARGVVTLTSSHLHAEVLTSDLASGTSLTVSFAGSEVPLLKAGSTLASVSASPSVTGAIAPVPLLVELGSARVSSDLTALLGLRNRPPSFCGSGDFLVSPSAPSVSDFSFLLARLLKSEVRRFSFNTGFPSGVVAAGESETALASVAATGVSAVGDTTGSSALASFFCYLIVSFCKS